MTRRKGRPILCWLKLKMLCQIWLRVVNCGSCVVILQVAQNILSQSQLFSTYARKVVTVIVCLFYPAPNGEINSVVKNSFIIHKRRDWCWKKWGSLDKNTNIVELKRGLCNYVKWSDLQFFHINARGHLPWGYYIKQQQCPLIHGVFVIF